MTTDYSSTINQVPPLNHDLYVQKPREEKDLSELYPDLGESLQLPVFFIGLLKNNEVKETSLLVGGNSTVASSGRPILNLKAPVFKKFNPRFPIPTSNSINSFSTTDFESLQRIVTVVEGIRI